MSTSASSRKATSFRHTRAIQTDHQHRTNTAPMDERVAALLSELVHPAIFTQMAAYHAAGLRERILTLPVMTAFVLGLIWQQLGSVSEAARILKREGFLWSAPVAVSQQALCERLHVLPPGLFAGILHEVLPLMQTRAQQRQRPLPRGLRRVQQHFAHILALDGSTLDGLLHKTGLLREEAGPVLAGRMAALLDLVTRLPRQVWFEDEATANDLRFWDTVIATVPAHSLLVIDGGFRNYQHFDELTQQHHAFLTPLASNSVVHVQTPLMHRPGLHDALVVLGQGKTRCQHTFRVVTWTQGSRTYRYLTNVLEPERLAAVEVIAVYAQRWRIEDAYLHVKRLLGLAYFQTGASNGIQTQVWATWVLYAALIDVADAIAEVVQRPLAVISLEMVYRGLYHFAQARAHGEAEDPVQYLATQPDLGIFKRRRKGTLTLFDALDFLDPSLNL